MGRFIQIFYHLIFSTKYRAKTLAKENRVELFKDIYGILKNNKSHVYRINGVEDHLHIVTSLHPTVSLSDLIKDIKLGSSAFIKQKKLFEQFNGWQDGYSAFTHAYSSKENLIEYVKNQEIHHQTTSFRDEIMRLCIEHGVRFDERYLD